MYYQVKVKSRTVHNTQQCTIRNSDIKIAHDGADDLVRHVTSKRHLDKGSVTKISTFFDQPTSFDLGVIRAETLFTHFLLEHNVGLSAADHAGKLFKQMFPHDPVAKK